MLFSCFRDGRPCGFLHATPRAALDHCRELRLLGEDGFTVGHGDGSALTNDEITALMSPEARQVMAGLARAFHAGAPDGDPH